MIYGQNFKLLWSHIPHCWKSHALAHLEGLMSDIKTLFGKLRSLIDTNMPEIVQQIDAVEGENLRAMTTISKQLRSLDNEASATWSNTSFALFVSLRPINNLSAKQGRSSRVEPVLS